MIKVEVEIPDLFKKLKEHERDLKLVVAAAMQTNRAMMFDKDGADNGKKVWEPLKWRSGRPLQKTGTLRKSFAPANDGIRPGHGKDSVLRFEGTKVVIGSQLLYARMMNDGTTKMPGGVLRPVRAKALRFPKPHGQKGFMFRKSVKIPARDMTEMTQADNDEIIETVQNYVTEVLNG